MAKNIRNTREYREAVLEALGTTQDKDVENEVNYKSALLEALEVEHTRSDVVNFETFRKKLIEGIANKSEGGGGSSDFSTAEVTISGAPGEEATVLLMPNIQDSDRRTGIEPAEVRASFTQKTYNVPLFKGHCLIKVDSGDVNGLTGNVTLNRGWLDVTGNCSLTSYYVQN